MAAASSITPILASFFDDPMHVAVVSAVAGVVVIVLVAAVVCICTCHGGTAPE